MSYEREMWNISAGGNVEPEGGGLSAHYDGGKQPGRNVDPSGEETGGSRETGSLKINNYKI